MSKISADAVETTFKIGTNTKKHCVFEILGLTVFGTCNKCLVLVFNTPPGGGLVVWKHLSLRPLLVKS